METKLCITIFFANMWIMEEKQDTLVRQATKMAMQKSHLVTI